MPVRTHRGSNLDGRDGGLLTCNPTNLKVAEELSVRKSRGPSGSESLERMLLDRFPKRANSERRCHISWRVGVRAMGTPSDLPDAYDRLPWAGEATE